ncbi:hypothetical protein NCCP2495_14040 [Dietzia sp. NCCP-2495]|nr:hypothetical protein NCCP2495_14040 [Dietzia sp. NCCP-2495]
MFAELVRAGLQALIEAEAAAKIGADRYERTEGRTTHRNGHRTKTASTPVEDIEAKIPKLRFGSFLPALLERRRRIDRALLRGDHAGLRARGVHPRREPRFSGGNPRA